LLSHFKRHHKDIEKRDTYKIDEMNAVIKWRIKIKMKFVNKKKKKDEKATTVKKFQKYNNLSL